MPFNQDLTRAVAPRAKTFATAPASERLWLYRQAGRLAERQKRIELMQAIGRFGVMDPRKRPRRDGANGPVMDPHGGRSRTFRLLTSSATPNSCLLYWRTNWTTILNYHASGEVRGAPVRDVRLSDAGIAAVQQQCEALWKRRPKQTKPAPAQTPAPAPRPAAPRPAPVRRPAASPVPGTPVLTALPRGRMKGPALLDERALRSKPFPTSR